MVRERLRNDNKQINNGPKLIIIIIISVIVVVVAVIILVVVTLTINSFVQMQVLPLSVETTKKTAQLHLQW